VLLLDADEDYAVEDKSALSGFPSKVELNLFDVVIWGDVDPRDPRIGDKNLQNLADFVRERGGGLLMIAGERFSPHAYKNTPLREIMPIEVTGPSPPEAEYTEGFHAELTGPGRFHPIFRFTPDEAENAAIWHRLPEFFWWSEGYRTMPAAEILAVHPRRNADKTEAAGRQSAPLRLPLIVQQFVGAGRSMFFGINETWRWRFRDQERYFNQFWIQTVRYLARSRLGRIDLRLDRQVPYRRGEPIKIMVRFPDDSPPPAADTEVKVVAERTLPKSSSQSRERQRAENAEIETQTLRLSKVEGSRATYETLLTRTPEGEYRFWLSSPTSTGSKPRVECRVLAPPGEMDLLRMNQQDLERAAEETHGRFYTLADADRLLPDLPAGNRVALNTRQPPRLLWNHFTLFALALLLLGSEWFLRKRKHLL
jgi:hypothetical protein